MKKKLILITVALTSLFSLQGAAQAGILNDLLQSDLVTNLVPPQLRKAVKSISAGNALGIDTLKSVFRPTDETDNIDEEQSGELEKIGFQAFNDVTKGNGITLSTINRIIKHTTLDRIDAVNNNKIRQQVKAIEKDRKPSVLTIQENSVDAESTLDAANKDLKLKALIAKNQMTQNDLISRELTAGQIRNANDLKIQEQNILKQKNEDIGLEASQININKLTRAITRPSYDMPK
jgi:hypothetical protein